MSEIVIYRSTYVHTTQSRLRETVKEKKINERTETGDGALLLDFKM